jgi:hypothetical protein
MTKRWLSCLPATARLLTTTLPLLISAAAAVFAWQQVEVGKDHNRRSVRPVLQITPYAEGKGGRNGIYISNDGLGPAILKGFAVGFNGHLTEKSELDRWASVLQAHGLDALCFATAWPLSGTVLKAGVEIPLLRVTSAQGRDDCVLQIVQLISDRPLGIQVEYESIYAEPFRAIASTRVHAASASELVPLGGRATARR